MTNIQIKKLFMKILIYSLNAGQIRILGESLDPKFDIFRESGFGRMVPIPSQTAAETLLRHFSTEDDIVRLFTYLLRMEGERLYDRTLRLWGKVEMIKMLEKYKWIFDEELTQFFRDPFYQHEINFFNDIKVIDLRKRFAYKKIINGITKISKKLSGKDLDWRITIRLYDLEAKSAQLVRKIIDLLLVHQDLQKYSYELFTCLKELALNASKANYKILFERFVTRKQQVTAQKDYFHFLRMFKEEIEEHGNARLFKLAKEEDKFINIIFQSTKSAIEIWVTNCENISLVEKEQMLKKIEGAGNPDCFGEDDYTEGAGLGINIVLSILRKHSDEAVPLKVIFYPGFVKVGFSLSRKKMLEEIRKQKEEQLRQLQEQEQQP